MARNAFFQDVLREMSEVHDKKNEDYAADGDPFSNFTGVAQMTGQPVDMVFFTMIGIKIMRLKELVGVGKDPNFESIDDSILDLANYAAIWKAYRLRTTALEAGEYYTQGNTEASLEEIEAIMDKTFGRGRA